IMANKDAASCQICLEQFDGRDPRMLPCQHAFCYKCIEVMLDTRRQSGFKPPNLLRCPMCKVQTQVERGSAMSLPPYYIPKKGQPLKKTPVKEKDAQSTCNICQKSDVSKFCLRCMKGMCAQCKAKHDRMQKNHPQVDADNKFMKAIMCQKHDRNIDAFCQTCRRSACSACRIADHFEHNVCDLIFEVNEENSVQVQIETVATVKKHFNEEIEMTKQHINSHRTQLLDELKRQYRILHSKLQKRQEVINARLDKSKDALINQMSRTRPIKDLPIARIDTDEKQPPIQVPEAKRFVFLEKPVISVGDIEELEGREFKYILTNVSKLTRDISSPTFYVHNIPWYILLKMVCADKENHLSVDVICNTDSLPSSWSLKVIIEIELVSQNSGKEDESIRTKSTVFRDIINYIVFI
ncbi:hypothetical protein LSH36_302g06000, partial [Paralvinella palmiformis]